MEPPIEGYVSPQGVGPIGFEMQAMEGVRPAPHPADMDYSRNGGLQDPLVDNRTQTSGYSDSKQGQRNLGFQNDNEGPVEKNTAGVSFLGMKSLTEGESRTSQTQATAGVEELEAYEDDIKLLPDNRQGKDNTETRGEKSLFFQDGKRRIDYVFAYNPNDDDPKKQQWRELFEDNLRAADIELEKDVVEYDPKNKVVYIKVHAPWSVLAAQAEITNMKMPLAPNDMTSLNRSCWSKCPTPFEYDKDILPPIPDYFTAPFSRDRAKQFIIEDEDNFFSPAERSLLVYQVLERCVFENNTDSSKNKFGIKKMVSSGAYDAAYPLHEGDYTSEHSLLTYGKENNRHLLYETWARPGVWYKFQPLDHIRQYFGEKIAIYFAWLGFYTGMLVPSAIVGLIAFLYGVGTFNVDPGSQDICDVSKAGNYVMCPVCDERCSYWFLQRSCLYSQVTYLFDNEATVAFAAFMALWATAFHEMWKRKTAELEYDWDVADFEEEETVRPEFEASVRKKRKNPINQDQSRQPQTMRIYSLARWKSEEPYLGFFSRVLRYVSSLWVVIFMLAVVLAAVFGVIVYRMTVSAVLYATDQAQVSKYSSTVTSVTAACINLVVIIVLSKVYLVIATVLTNFETHRTQTEWEDSFTLKMFFFQFVNHNASLVYIAFFKGKFLGRPGKYNREIDGKRHEECDPAGCLIELLIQLAIVMVGKQMFNNFKEIITPKLLNWFKSRRVKEEEEKQNKKVAQWEKDYNMASMPDLGLFDEYLEMVIQFGFVTIFVAAFPLAPLFALLNNIIEIRLDAYKFVTQWRRPLAARAQDIGIWFGILRGISTLAVVSNACIIAFTSEFIPKLVYQYGYGDTGNVTNYIDFSLSTFAVKDFEKKSFPQSSKADKFGIVTECRYRDFRYPPGTPDEYSLTMVYWHVLTARLAFVIVFIMVVVFLQWLISFLVPDVPRHVKLQILREKHIAKESILTAEMRRREGGDTGVTTKLIGGEAPEAQQGGSSVSSHHPLY
ncbi:anoctamin-4-like isoform X3 [Pomacea canaliculata]|uniref:anoctamin-4-like isoform X3 n=1 Tax=Pomacea canaliculata TaxID=400727 RepID=UPI000D737E5F|nr:anoctamin-4-like isoform X3 [Pomacea canaliculata]